LGTDGAKRLTLVVAEPALDAASVAAYDAPAVAVAANIIKQFIA